MSKLEEFKKIFDSRHDFNDSDLMVLKERHPSVEFINIPTAWIFQIDEALCWIRYSNPITKISQEYGQLIIEYSKDPDMQPDIDRIQPFLVILENKVYETDQDLYQNFGINIGE